MQDPASKYKFDADPSESPQPDPVELLLNQISEQPVPSQATEKTSSSYITNVEPSPPPPPTAARKSPFRSYVPSLSTLPPLISLAGREASIGSPQIDISAPASLANHPSELTLLQAAEIKELHQELSTPRQPGSGQSSNSQNEGEEPAGESLFSNVSTRPFPPSLERGDCLEADQEHQAAATGIFSQTEMFWDIDPEVTENYNRGRVGVGRVELGQSESRQGEHTE